MTTEIVASFAAETAADVVASELGATKYIPAERPDLVELRLDRLREPLAAILAACRPGLRRIVAIRTRREGGHFDGSEADLVARLHAAAAIAERVDVEAGSAAAHVDFGAVRKIVSHHDPHGMPADLDALVAGMRAAHRDAACFKLAVTPRSLADVARLVQLQRRATEATHSGAAPLAVMGLGELGLPTRHLAGKLGAPLVYGHAPSARPTAPGQPSAAELATIYRVRSQRSADRICAVVGNPVAHSLGPRLHNHWFGQLFEQTGARKIFIPLLAASLDEALAVAGTLDLDGLSVTLPFKEAALRAAIGAPPGFPWPIVEGAFNTLLRSERGWLAVNTDRIGFARMVEAAGHPGSLHGQSALVLGAGGVARTVVALLTERGAAVTIAGRTPARATALAARFGARTAGLERAEIGRHQLVVNATPVGMHPHVDASPLPDGVLHAGQCVLDLVYRPRRTRLLGQAEAAGARTVDGTTMFLAQALAQAERFASLSG